MRFSMKTGCARLALLAAIVAFATLAASAQVTKASTVTLVCNNKIKRADLLPHITIDLSEGEGRVSVHYPATSIAYPGGAVVNTPAKSLGPFPATFDSKTIAFDVRDGYNEGFYQRYTLDRMSGNLLDYTSVKAPFDEAPPDDRVVWHYTCKVGKAKF